VTYVNHTFQSHLALSASLQPYAGLSNAVISEYPFELKALAYEMTANHIERDANGYVRAPDAPGLGITLDSSAIRKYLVDTEIVVNGQVLYRTPDISAH
jgi:L-alanine-DL-glutamate epimerase-like enolase superfamily enzyme